jgi:hypothetical protein
MRTSTGLLSSTALTGSGTGPQGFDGMAPEEEGQPNVAPEEQEEYDTFVKNAMEVMYSEKGEIEQEVLKRLATGKKPIDSLSQTTVWLTMMLEQSAKQKGMEISDDVLLHAGREILEQLAEIASSSKIHDFKQAELQGAWYNALDMYREANSEPGDRFRPDEAAAAFEALNEADKEGRADEVVPGFYQQTEKSIAVAQQDQAPTQDEDEEGGDEKVMNRRAMGLMGDG